MTLKNTINTPTIFFDMDGTIADLYQVNNWLNYLIKENPLPYQIAKPLIELTALTTLLKALKEEGYKIGIISWLSKNSSEEYDKLVIKAKKDWLKKHLTDITFDEINIVKYGTPKNDFIKSQNDILFDDEQENRKHWSGIAYDEKNILDILKILI